MDSPIPADLTSRFGDTLALAADGAWEIVAADAVAAREALVFLGRECQPPFDYFIDLLGVDAGDHIEVITQLSRVMTGELVRVKVRVARRGGAVSTVSDIWPGASWPERELMEMFGVNVEGHPDPRHLLLPEDWKGFPLRKDYVYPAEHPWLSRDPLHEGPSAGPPGDVEAAGGR